MGDRVPVFDSWGNYIGYFQEETGCSSGIFSLVLIIPLVAIFYLVNVFRIGRRLIDKRMYIRAFLWFGMWLLPSLLASVQYFMAQGVSANTLDLEFLPSAIVLPLGIVLLLSPCISAIVGVVHLFLAFKYSNLNF